MEEKDIVNRVAESSLVTLNLEEFQVKGERVIFDLSSVLYEGLVLREKDLRDFVLTHDWKKYQSKFVALHCSTDAIVPTWAYMLIAAHLEPYAASVVFGDLIALESVLFKEAIDKMDVLVFKDKPVIVKGCSNVLVPESAYIGLIAKLRPHVKSLFYGEACSTVPLYKRK